MALDTYEERSRVRALSCKVCDKPSGRRGPAWKAKYAYCTSCAETGVDHRIAVKMATKQFHGRRPTPFSDRLRNAAANFVKVGLECGLIPKLDGSQACADCGATADCYDHRDYGRPLEVDPVCKGCNCRRSVANVGKLYELAWARREGAIEAGRAHLMRAIRLVGHSNFMWQMDESIAALARWYVFGVPDRYCDDIEELTGGAVTMHDLRPDLFKAPSQPARPTEQARAA